MNTINLTCPIKTEMMRKTEELLLCCVCVCGMCMNANVVLRENLHLYNFLGVAG